MSFFKDLKEDIAQSVNELTESLDENLAVDDEKTKETVTMSELTTDFPPEEPAEEVPELVVENNETEENEIAAAAEPEEVIEEPVEAPVEEVVDEPEEIEEPVEDYEEEDVMNEEVMEEASIDNTPVEEVEDDAQEVTVITKGTTINGGIKSDTSLVVKGTIEGDVECEGKLTITGKVAGNTIASEIYVNTPRLEGDINSRGIVKIDVGTVVIGSISCTSVLVAGAVKGNIEVNGPVIVDSTAVVQGDIKAKSIQINSGAVIDGHCSLAYADVDLDSFFE
jgi:hypothetical protein